MRNLSLGRRHLVNAYEVKAGIGVIAGKLCDQCLSALRVLYKNERCIKTLTFCLYITRFCLSVCLLLCLSVCLSVTLVHCIEMAKRVSTGQVQFSYIECRGYKQTILKRGPQATLLATFPMYRLAANLGHLLPEHKDRQHTP